MAGELDQVTQEGKDRAGKTPTPTDSPSPMPSGMSPDQAASQAAPSVANLPPDMQAMLIATSAMLAANNKEESDGPRVVLNREVKGPTFGPTYVNKPPQYGQEVNEPPNRTATGRGPINPYGVVAPGSIDVQEGDYNELIKNGFLGSTNEAINDAVILAANGDNTKFDAIYKGAITVAAYRQKAGEQSVTTLDVLNEWIKGGLPDGLSGKSGGGGGGGGGPFSSTQTQVNLTNEGTARRIINDSLTRELGRAATKDEVKMFLKALNAQEKANPTVTKTTGYSSGGNTTSKSNTTGGFDGIDFAERFARSQEGYAEYQAATTYMDAFIDALESDSRVI